MTVRVADDGTIMLEGNCPAGDAETLARMLLLDPAAPVDWRASDHLHTAVAQVLLAARRLLVGAPGSLFVRNWIAPALSGAPMSTTALVDDPVNPGG